MGDIVCRPKPNADDLDPTFCLDFGVSCFNDKRLIAFDAQIETAAPTVIQDGGNGEDTDNGGDVDSGDDTSNGNGGTTTTSTSTKDATPINATASVIGKTSSTTTKTTINKKY